VALLPWLDYPRGRRRDRRIVVDPLDTSSLMLGYVLLHVIDVRCCAEPAVDLLYSRGVVVSCLLLNTICENKK
jgi:hypothetical protein